LGLYCSPLEPIEHFQILGQRRSSALPVTLQQQQHQRRVVMDVLTVKDLLLMFIMLVLKEELKGFICSSWRQGP
jgi:hypothetical protein